ncbi:hypothetical protein PF008_g32736, partial [Phytophthora fragariae]
MSCSRRAPAASRRRCLAMGVVRSLFIEILIHTLCAGCYCSSLSGGSMLELHRVSIALQRIRTVGCIYCRGCYRIVYGFVVEGDRA